MWRSSGEWVGATLHVGGDCSDPNTGVLAIGAFVQQLLYPVAPSLGLAFEDELVQLTEETNGARCGIKFNHSFSDVGWQDRKKFKDTSFSVC